MSWPAGERVFQSVELPHRRQVWLQRPAKRRQLLLLLWLLLLLLELLLLLGLSQEPSCRVSDKQP